MNNQKALVLVAVIAWCGVLLQLYISLSNAVLDGRGVINGLVRYFAYFTILTNIFVDNIILPLVNVLPILIVT